MTHRITTLILPVAGRGTRLRPLTNRTPKALVRVNGIPLLDYILDDAEQSSITTIVIVVSPYHLQNFRTYIVRAKKKFPGIRVMHLAVQREPLGDGHAVLQGLHSLVGSGPVAVRFADDLILDSSPTIASLVAHFEAHGDAPIMLLERVPKVFTSRYGIVGIRGSTSTLMGLPRGRTYRLESFVEKPASENAPSDLGVVGGYVLTPRFISLLKKQGRALRPKQHDALRLADIFRTMLRKGMPVYGWEFPGRRLDCGTLEGFYEAQQMLKKYENRQLKIKKTAQKKRQ